MALKFIENSKPVHFEWKDSRTNNYGFIAQDLVNSGFTDLVSAVPASEKEKHNLTKNEYKGVTASDGFKLVVNYEQIIPLVTNAVKYIYTELVKLSERVSSQSAAVKKLESDNVAKSAEIQKLKDRATKAEKENNQIKAYLCHKDKHAPFCH